MIWYVYISKKIFLTRHYIFAATLITLHISANLACHFTTILVHLLLCFFEKYKTDIKNALVSLLSCANHFFNNMRLLKQNLFSSNAPRRFDRFGRLITFTNTFLAYVMFTAEHISVSRLGSNYVCIKLFFGI